MSSHLLAEVETDSASRSAQESRMISKTIDLAGETLHYADYGGEGPTLVLVHGLGGSYTAWLAVAASLARRARVVALDLPGFGHSPRSARGTTLSVMGRALARFIDATSTEAVHLVGNSMGGALSLLEAHARPQRIASALLVDPALPAPLGVDIDPWWLKTLAIASVPMGHRLLRRRAKRLGRERLLRDLMDVCCVDATRIPAEVMDALVAEAVECGALPQIDLAFSEATRSLLGELFFGRRLRKAVRLPGVPTLIVHGQRDRCVDVRTVRATVAINPQIELIELPDLGHTPQLEAPDAFLKVASGWFDRVASTSGGRQDAPVRLGRAANG
jgi:pimeloyl-ACP methyl ester carboxylesterase